MLWWAPGSEAWERVHPAISGAEEEELLAAYDWGEGSGSTELLPEIVWSESVKVDRSWARRSGQGSAMDFDGSEFDDTRPWGGGLVNGQGREGASAAGRGGGAETAMVEPARLYRQNKEGQRLPSFAKDGGERLEMQVPSSMVRLELDITARPDTPARAALVAKPNRTASAPAGLAELGTESRLPRRVDIPVGNRAGSTGQSSLGARDSENGAVHVADVRRENGAAINGEAIKRRIPTKLRAVAAAASAVLAAEPQAPDAKLSARGDVNQESAVSKEPRRNGFLEASLEASASVMPRGPSSLLRTARPPVKQSMILSQELDSARQEEVRLLAQDEEAAVTAAAVGLRGELKGKLAEVRQTMKEGLHGLDVARRSLQQLVLEHPLSAEVWVHYAQLERKAGDVGAARSRYDQAFRAFDLVLSATKKAVLSQGDASLDEISKDSSTSVMSRRGTKLTTNVSSKSDELVNLMTAQYSRALQARATLEAREGLPDQARRLFRKSLKISRQVAAPAAVSTQETTLADARPSSEELPGRTAVGKKVKLPDSAESLLSAHVVGLHSWAMMELRSSGGWARARELLERAEALQPGNAVVLQSRALLEKEAHNWDTARNYFKRATKAAPTDAVCWQTWALFEAGGGRVKEMRRLFRKALELAPSSPFVLQAWAVQEEKLGGSEGIEEARRLYRKCTQVAPHSLHARQAWGLLEQRAGNVEEARRLFEGCLKEGPSDVATLQAYARLEEQCGNLQAARGLLARALAVDPSNAPSLMAAAQLEERLGFTLAAEQLYQRKGLADRVVSRRRRDMFLERKISQQREGKLGKEAQNGFHAEGGVGAKERSKRGSMEKGRNNVNSSSNSMSIRPERKVAVLAGEHLSTARDERSAHTSSSSNGSVRSSSNGRFVGTSPRKGSVGEADFVSLATDSALEEAAERRPLLAGAVLGSEVHKSSSDSNSSRVGSGNGNGARKAMRFTAGPNRTPLRRAESVGRGKRADPALAVRRSPGPNHRGTPGGVKERVLAALASPALAVD
eukprot:TRINITY_DN29373_c0_g1_i1.p1 TRINITY_DN29373_c0_g1~~TRINITY_DN29373_c0_g1_i1.p1  ORF type:complete len:1025 (+),score=216.61 TRINITY_DN29373_c0_g1_i1:809-3883(+)